ncbi:MAG: threonine ammonia-lyase [Candidatus Sedimenticola sp. 6PFRAG7]
MVDLAEIEAARLRIRDSVFYTPCAYSESLSHLAGCNLYLKLENLQMTGSFKDRGSLNKMLQLNEEQREAGVITASAGNHAQGVAHAARICGVRATIVMPETTPLAKIRGTRELGAEIILHGSGYDDASEKAQALQQAQGYTLIHAFDDEQIIAGQGTIGLEIIEQVPDIDTVVIPVGGGGLISGIGTAISSLRPQARIIGVEAARMPSMKKSIAAGQVSPHQNASTLADGIAVARVGQLTLPITRKLAREIITVTEDEISNAIMVLLEREKTLAEGAGAAGFAALYNGHIKEVAGKNVVVVISGGNIDMTMLARILERGLETDGRIARLKVIIKDKPGNIATLTTLVAGHQSNILQISQNRDVSEVQLEETEVELLLETRGKAHVGEIVSSLNGHGFKVR